MSTVSGNTTQSGFATGGGMFESFFDPNKNAYSTRYRTLGGGEFDNYFDYARGIIQEREQNPDLYEKADRLGLSGPQSAAFGDDFSKVLDQNFKNTSNLMELTNRYRTKEGATQGQMDEQAYRRLTTQINSQERQRQFDSSRAIKGFKGQF